MSDSASSEVVRFELKSPHIALVTLNRPDARNAVNGEVAEALGNIVDCVDADSDIRVVVLTGAGGKVFSAGADLKAVSAGHMAQLYRPGKGFAGFVDAKRKTPWIAAVEGLALAGGCELALACDMIVASHGGAFGLPEVTRGLIAAAGGLYRLPRALPVVIATELILTADRLPAEKAAEFGMVNHLVTPGETVAKALEIAEKIAANAPLAVTESLAVIAEATKLNEDELAQLSLDRQDVLSKTEDFAEGPLAFIEKRAPVWKGR
jgi:enoyl-CoA hydratase/carnithine racemase